MTEISSNQKPSSKMERTDFIGGLLGLKMTYFFLFGSYGAIWPYLALYFRQNGLNAGYVGVIAGIRPMIQFISCPFWSVLADKFNASRLILNMSVISWFVMTVFLFIPKPSIIHCPESLAKNLSAASLFDSPEFHNKSSLTTIEEVGGKKHFISKIKTFILNSPEMSHVSDSQHFNIYNENNISKNASSTNHNNDMISTRSISSSLIGEPSKFPIFLYEYEDVMRVFWWIFVLTIVGEFFEAPSVSLLDTSILQCLQNSNKYGHIRLYGSLGFGFSSFIVGFTLDHARKTICGKIVTNFIVIVYFFIAWMAITVVICLIAVRFPQSEYDSTKSSFLLTLKIFLAPKYGIFLCISFYMGFSHGSIMNFINWYLEDLGANRLMMGTATILRDFAVVLGFYLSPKILQNFNIKFIFFWVFSVYIFSYFSYSMIFTPWMAVPVEALQGLAFAIMWASSIDHLAKVSDPSNYATMQGIIQGVYWGLGTGTGAIIGGICIHVYGSQASFRLGGYATLVAAAIFTVAYLIAEKFEKKSIK